MTQAAPNLSTADKARRRQIPPSPRCQSRSREELRQRGRRRFRGRRKIPTQDPGQAGMRIGRAPTPATALCPEHDRAVEDCRHESVHAACPDRARKLHANDGGYCTGA